MKGSSSSWLFCEVDSNLDSESKSYRTQLINATMGSYDFDLNSQQCVPCGPLNYIVDPGSGGTCQECPKVSM